MPTYAIPPEGCASFLTAGKRYEVLREDDLGFCITDNDGEELYCLWRDCWHERSGSWTWEEVTQNDTETLRDRFAMAALQGELAAQNGDDIRRDYSDGDGVTNLATWSYCIANAMMIARRKV
jgi:hypothetical protein